MKKLRIFAIVFAVLILAYGAATAGLYIAMSQPPEAFGAIMAKVPMVAMIVLPFEPLWMSARKGALAPGDPAPDFTLPTVSGSGSVTISQQWRDRPVVLIFGSYT
jgi:hypothetical protein